MAKLYFHPENRTQLAHICRAPGIKPHEAGSTDWCLVRPPYDRYKDIINPKLTLQQFKEVLQDLEQYRD